MTALPTSRPNPQKLNTLQLKTLAILQELARDPEAVEPEDAEGRVAFRYLPEAHGDHFHVGAAVVMSRDATGLKNPAVYGALERKGLLARGPRGSPALTREGRDYETGIAASVLHRSDH